MKVTHENFDGLLNNTLDNAGRFIIPTYTRITVIESKHIKKWNAAGMRLLWKDTDGRGFRMASGKKSIYVLPGQLKYQEVT